MSSTAKIIAAAVVIAAIVSLLYFQPWTPQKTVYHTVTWDVVDTGLDEATGASQSEVGAIIDGTRYSAGTYNGTCSDTGLILDANQIAGILCWFAGGGDEIGVFEEGGRLVIKRGEHGEPTAESPAFRGNFVTILEVAE